MPGPEATLPENKPVAIEKIKHQYFKKLPAFDYESKSPDEDDEEEQNPFNVISMQPKKVDPIKRVIPMKMKSNNLERNASPVNPNLGSFRMPGTMRNNGSYKLPALDESTPSLNS